MQIIVISGKPFRQKENFCFVRSSQKSRAVGSQFGSEFCNLSLDSTSALLFRSFRFLPSCQVEFQMMELLITNPRQIISRNVLCRKIWGYDNGLERSSCIDGYISSQKAAHLSEPNVKIKAARGAEAIIWTEEEI